MTRKEYWTEIINNMTLDELREINKIPIHCIWSGDNSSDFLYKLFMDRFRFFGREISEFDLERDEAIKLRKELQEKENHEHSPM